MVNLPLFVFLIFQSLVRESFKKRRELLHSSFKEVEGVSSLRETPFSNQATLLIYFREEHEHTPSQLWEWVLHGRALSTVIQESLPI